MRCQCGHLGNVGHGMTFRVSSFLETLYSCFMQFLLPTSGSCISHTYTLSLLPFFPFKLVVDLFAQW